MIGVVVLRPVTVFTTAGLLLAIAIVSFCFFMKVNRRNKDEFDRQLRQYNEAIRKIKDEVSVKLEQENSNREAQTKSVANVALYPRRVKFMAPNGSCYDVPMLDSIIIGNNSRCDFCVDHRTVSELHCKIIYSDHEYFIQDLGSKNGTFIDGNRIPGSSVYKLHSGVLQVGKATFFLTINED